MKMWSLLIVAVSVLNTTLLADEVLLKNGERLTGTVKGLDGGKLTVVSESLGELKIDIGKVKRFTAAKPATIVLKDGSILHLQIAAFENGQLQLAPATRPASTTRVASTTVPFSTTGLASTTAPVSTMGSALPPGPAPTTQPVAATESPRIGGEAGVASPAARAAVASGSLPIAQVQKINPPDPKWTGSVTAGAVLTRGNSYSDSVATSAEASRRGEVDRTTLAGDYAYGRQKDTSSGEQITSIDSWNALSKYDYYFSKHWYDYVGVKATHDRVADLELRLMPAAGVGYQWVENSRTNINTEVGVNWVYERFSNPARTDDFFAARFAYHIEHKLNDSVSFIHNFEFLPDVSDFANHLINTDAGIRTKLTSSFFAEFKMSLTYNSTPAENKEKTDVRYMASLGYTF